MNAVMGHFDIFISYARIDGAWVRENLYEPLLRCQTREGRRPRIFFDKGKQGMVIGQNFIDAQLQAIWNCKKLVAVYSKNYFNGGMCLYELMKTLEQDPLNRFGKICPILIDPSAQIHPAVSLISYWEVASPDWFAKLCESLEVIPGGEPAALKFMDQPVAITVNHTFPPLRVSVTNEEGIIQREELITIRSETGALEGTVTCRSNNGVAIFEDLSMSTPVAATRLIATAEGHEDAISGPFAVTKPIAPPLPKPSDRAEEMDQPLRIPARGEVVFFADGKAFCVISEGSARVYDLRGKPLISETDGVKLTDRLRFVRRSSSLLVLADWSGRIYAFSSDGRDPQSWDCGGQSPGFAVPGDAAISDGKIFVGFWNGMVYRLAFGEEAAVAEFKADMGAQALSVVGGRFYVCGFDGSLRVYKGGHLVNTAMLEPAVWLLQASGTQLLAVGDQKLYQIALDPLRVLSSGLRDDLRLSEVAAVLGDVQLPVVIDTQGKGIRFNSELVSKSIFHTTAGAIPISADNAGRYCVFINPDGSRTLMVNGRVIFSSEVWKLSVAPAADLFALADENGIRLLEPSSFERLLEGVAVSV